MPCYDAWKVVVNFSLVGIIFEGGRSDAQNLNSKWTRQLVTEGVE